MKQKIRNIGRIIALLRKGWKIRFAYTKKFPGSKPGVTITPLCDTLDSAEETERRMKS